MMMSPAFVAFVEEATGLRNLESDDSNYWAGLHASGRGAFSSLHRDFAVHPVTRKWHRVNALLFLNSDWREEYGGDLELWSSDLVACGARIKPDAGTLVIFETNDATLHGIPDPIACPKGRMRLSLAVYYYSDEPWPESPHEFRFRRARRPQDPWWIGVPDLAEVASIVLDPLTGRIPVVRRFMNALRSRRS
jgi:Rps23 Pro-64 3,4-dihydroxylase Tpa1-like proline 4-hydroxylase